MKHACRQATKLASDGLDRRLSAWELLRLRYHLLLCGHCRSCAESMQIIHKTTELIRNSQYENIKLSEAQRQHLREELEKAAGC